MVQVDSDDPRVTILNRLLKEDKGTGEFIANHFLSQLSDDLGTIRRSLIDLYQSELIAFSSIEKDKDVVSWLNEIMDTETNSSWVENEEDRKRHVQIKKDKKSSERLITDVGEFPRVPPLRVYLRLNGLKYLLDFDNSKNTNWHTKPRNYLMTSIGLLLFGGIVGWFLNQFSIKQPCESNNYFSVEECKKDRNENAPLLDSLK